MSESAYRSNSSITPLLIVVLILIGGVAGWWLWPRPEPPPPPPTPTVVDAGVIEDEPEEEEPPMEAVKDIEVDPALEEWLAVPGIVRRVAAATWRVSNGDSPSPVLGFLALSGRFEVRDEDDSTFVDPAGYRRYDAIVDRIVAVDPERAAEAYQRLRPRFDRAFREIAAPGERFHTVAKQAVQMVLGVKVPKGKIELVGKGATFFYADDNLENMAAAEKHILRLGPKNASRVQAWLRKVAQSADLL